MNSKMFIFPIIFLIFSFIIILALIGTIFDTRTVYDIFCEEELNGQVWTYECQEIPFATPCSKLKTGKYCRLSNGDEISYGNLTKIFNSTTS